MTTQAERLAKMEAILERVEAKVESVEGKVDRVEGKVDRDVADLAQIKNRGTGILIGVAVAAGGIGAGFSAFWRWLASLVT